MSDLIIFGFGCAVSLIVLSAVVMLLWATGTDRASSRTAAPPTPSRTPVPARVRAS